MDDALHDVFLEETLPLAAQIESRLLHIERDAAALDDAWRAVLGTLHTIKGNCGMVGLDPAQGLAHAMEQQVREVRGWPPGGQAGAVETLLGAADLLRRTVETGDEGGETAAALARLHGMSPGTPAVDAPRPDDAPAAGAEPTASIDAVRVDSARLDRLLESTADLATWLDRLRAAAPPTQATSEALDGATRRLGELRDAVLALRLVPLSALLVRFERLVRDLGRALGKRAVLAVRGAEIGVDKHVIDRLGEPLLHMIRNAIDHGLETPAARTRAGKEEVGTITVAASARGGVLSLTVRDDGRGIDPARLVAAAARRGIDAAGWSPARILDLVFAPDLSTSETVTELSGRGVGLDQARRALERIGGSVQVSSTPGAGTELHIRVPLVVAVQRSLVVSCGGALFGIPFTSVVEAFRISREDVNLEGAPWRDTRIPVRFLRRLLELEVAEPASTLTCVVIDAPDLPMAVVVDELRGHHDLMVGELDPIFDQPRGVTGVAALADGSIVAVLDPLAVAS
jgi:two-component system, chemotaxis family, sensor kinase CheA